MYGLYDISNCVNIFKHSQHWTGGIIPAKLNNQLDCDITIVMGHTIGFWADRSETSVKQWGSIPRTIEQLKRVISNHESPVPSIEPLVGYILGQSSKLGLMLTKI